MFKYNVNVRMPGILTICLLVFISLPSQATQILVSGNSMNDSNPQFTQAIAGLGLQATFVAPSSFSNTRLDDFDIVWLDGFSQFGNGPWSSNLMTFMNGGGNVFVQNPGFGSESMSTYPLGDSLAADFTYPPGQNTIRILETSNPVNLGLDSTGLSLWNSASGYGYFTSITGFTGLTDTGTAGQWVTLMTPVGAGYLVYTQQGVSQYLSDISNPGSKSQAARFLYNVSTLGSTSVPVPPTLGLFLVGVMFVGWMTAHKSGIARQHI